MQERHDLGPRGGARGVEHEGDVVGAGLAALGSRLTVAFGFRVQLELAGRGARGHAQA